MKKRNMVFGCLALSSAVLAAPPCTIPSMKAPELDGVLSDGEWSAAWHQKLTPIYADAKITQETICYAGCDQEYLYLAFRCSEAQPEQMRQVFRHAEERDSAIFQDDCVEFLFDLSGSKKPSLFHFAVNSCGVFYDGWNDNPDYQSNLKVACKVGKDFWVVEARLPFADLGISPHGAETFKMNLGRERHEQREYSCLVSGKGSFTELEHFVVFRPMPPGAETVPISILGFGSPLEPQLTLGNTSVTDAQKHTVTVETLDAMMAPLKTVQAEVQPGAEVCRVNYASPGKNPMAAVRISLPYTANGSRKNYTATCHFPLVNSNAKLRAMKIENPLFESLLSDVKPQSRSFHGIQWQHGVGQPGLMRMFALQNALPYSDREVAKDFVANNMAIYSNSKMVNWTRDTVFANEPELAILGMPRVLSSEIKTQLPYTICILPEQRKAFLNEIKKLASDPSIPAIVVGDEVSETVDNQIVEQFAKHPDDPDLIALDKKIKEKYGQGKYGIPASLDENNPIALIAYRRALNDELVALFREAAQLARSIHPGIVLISDDPVGAQNRLYSFADQRGIFDIATHQLYPRRNPHEDEFGFLTRYLGDLMQTEVWPCPHVEEYGCSFTPEEVLYLLSATVRNGATGFNYYLHDTTGSRSGQRYLVHERWGAPDRYAVEINAQKFLRNMPKLKFPEQDVALFSSTDSLRAISGAMFHSHTDKDTFLHGFLGYGAGVSYRFINEETLQNLEPYKLIVTVESKYLPRDAFDKLQSYVQNGGTLLIVDPFALGYTPEGAELKDVRKALTGVTVGPASENPEYFTYAGQKIEVGSISCFKLTPEPGAKVLASFANGDPAVVEYRLGKGRTVSLALDPCVVGLAGNANWNGFFHRLAESCQAKVNCDIWRFQLPESLLPQTVELPGICLTNNAIRWEHFNPVRINGCSVTGSYSLTPEPDYVKDHGSGEISFADGKLTDRPRAVVAGSCCKEKSVWSDWAVGWQKEQPITIKAKWSDPHPVKSVKLIVANVWNGAKIEIGGKSFDYPCPEDFNADPLSVREVKMALPETVTASELTIRIAPTADKTVIGEMEIWGE